ncbi:glycosyltransferase family 28 C-terminal domain-domain-containing protein [Kockovaella imperatae]|uniref:UDP-N-acetylglucosamine transferase subunit ALG13 n=1 Tax=Kockovaella imperatae TaxID=4999 RepID=A0A1Y1U756_9TREE|nr:glycosyltransferase family 28 C-terminal domain-domain-containing protein [Kockovaella imperatae]ORX33863.1 glycosyltransferase family 28 C-terminal domain-domain-containing protein [Kockovaella imperatae]
MSTSASKAAASESTQSGSYTLLVTVGSTLFPELTNCILSSAILSILPSLGIKLVNVQYGKADLLAHEEIEDLEIDAQGSGEFTWTDYNGAGQVNVHVFRYTNDLSKLIKESDAVISHAGSGSILEVIRSKPLLVVPNSSLMDNHQAQLADALGDQGYLISSTVEQLDSKLALLVKSIKQPLKPFPALDKARFPVIVDQTMGFE